MRGDAEVRADKCLDVVGRGLKFAEPVRARRSGAPVAVATWATSVPHRHVAGRFDNLGGTFNVLAGFTGSRRLGNVGSRTQGTADRRDVHRD